MSKVVLLGAFLVITSGCVSAIKPTCPDSRYFKDSIATQTSGLQRYVKNLPVCSKAVEGIYSKKCLDFWVSPLANLRCVVDQDLKKSTDEKPTVACACGQPKNEESGQAACSEWLSSNN